MADHPVFIAEFVLQFPVLVSAAQVETPSPLATQSKISYTIST